MVPGIDLSGVVSHHVDRASAGDDEVVLRRSWGVGEGHWGGMAEKKRQPKW